MAAGNPFSAPLQSELQEHQQQQAATVEASPNNNPFAEPLASEKAEAAHDAAQKQTIQKPISQLFGGMHGGSYDIAFRDPQGQISPETIKAEAAGGTAGDALGILGAYAVPQVISHLDSLHKVVQAAKALGYGSFGLKEAHDLYKSLTGSKK